MMHHNNIVLTGFMGTGKTSVGQRIAELMNREFIDTDVVIEHRQQKTINEIFSHQGESHFRKLESQLCEELSTQKNFVISTGGGTFLSKTNRELFERDSKIFCLTAHVDTILQRLSQTSHLPLFPRSRQDIAYLMQSRAFAYNAIHHQIATDNRSIDEIAHHIIELSQLELPSHNLISVQTSTGQRYPIVVGNQLFEGDKLALWLKWLGISAEKIVILADSHIANIINLGSLSPHIILIPSGESHKTLQTVETIYEQLLDIGLTRHQPIIAIGGGVTLDIAGFVAATYLRGVPVIHIPTTLLAMVDASCGGKTGVDLPQGKNLVGAFKQPHAVLVDTDMLSSLPSEEWRCGMAEVIKHAIIDDGYLWNLLENYNRGDLLTEIITYSIQVKKNIVEEDPHELSNRRALLNLGHTFAHAFEQASRYELKHGFAVAMGLAYAAQLSLKLGKCDSQFPQKITAMLEKFGLPTRFDGSWEKALIAMKFDKKRQNSICRFVLPCNIGNLEICEVKTSIIAFLPLRNTAYA